MNRELVDSGVEWIGKIPSNWEIRKLSSIAKRITDYVASGSFATIKKNVTYLDKPDYAMLIRTADLSQKTNKEPVYINKHSYEFLSNSNLFGGELILPNIGSVGEVYYYEPMYERASLAPNAILVDMKGSNRFYYYFFKNPLIGDALKNLGNDSVQAKFNKTQLRQLKVLNPPFEEQKKIANFLDEKVSQINLIIRNTKQSIEELNKYKQSIITETVTRGINPNIEMKDSGIEGLEMVPKHWNIVKLRYLIQFQPPKSEIKEKNIECTFLPMEKLKNGKMVLDKNRIIDEVYTGYTYFKENDIVLAKVTPCFENGNIAIAKNLTNSIGFGTTEIYTLRAKKISKEFLFYALQDERFKNEGISSMYGTGGLKRVPGNFILNYKVLVPSNTEQQQIVDFLNEKTEYIENLIIKKKELLNEMESYKKSLIYEYVTGKKEVM